MKFTDLRDDLEKAKQLIEKKPNSLDSFEKEFFLDIEYRKKTLLESLQSGKALEHLYDDLIKEACFYEFHFPLSKKDYEVSNEFAFTCVEMSFEAEKIHYRRVGDWTKNALKAFDVLVLKIYTEVLDVNEVYKTTDGKKPRIYETEVYQYLQEQEDEDYRLIGSNFKSIYQLRSEFEHIQQVTKWGKRSIKPIPN